MKRLRFTLAVLIPVLMLTLMFFTSCEEDSKGIIGDPIDHSTASVDHFSVSINKDTHLGGYFGALDTLKFTITAFDDADITVEDAEFEFDIEGTSGIILADNNNKTNSSGVLEARYAVVFAKDDTVRAKIAILNSTTLAEYYDIFLAVEDVRVEISAAETDIMVASETQAVTEIEVSVKNNNNNLVPGVPIKLSILQNEDEEFVGTLTEPLYDETSFTYKSTLTIPFVNEPKVSLVRGYIDVEVPDGSPVINSGQVSVTASPNSVTIETISVQIDTSYIVASPGEDKTTNVKIYAKDASSVGVEGVNLYSELISLDGSTVGSMSTLGATEAGGLVETLISTTGNSGLWALVVKTHENAEYEGRDTLQVINGDIQSISLSADTTKLSVLGTGGENSTTLRAKVRDENGNFVADGTMVHFLLKTFPYTVSADTSDAYTRPAINGYDDSEYFDEAHLGALYGLPYDSVETYQGEASITFTTGSETGFLSFDVWTYTLEGNQISTNYRGLTIFSGPPERIEVDYDPRGIQYAAGVWALELSARVQDALGNDVVDMIQVDFEGDQSYATFSSGLTGITSPLSDNMTPGVAYSFLTYHSDDTNKPLEIMAKVLTGIGAIETDSYPIEYLPIQLPQGETVAVPANWNFGQDGAFFAKFTLTTRILDGYEHLINGEDILYGPTQGHIYNEYGTHNPQNVTPYATTGIKDYYGPDDNDPVGTAVRYFTVTPAEAFPDGVSTEKSIMIETAIVRGLDSSIETVTLRLYAELE